MASTIDDPRRNSVSFGSASCAHSSISSAKITTEHTVVNRDPWSTRKTLVQTRVIVEQDPAGAPRGRSPQQCNAACHLSEDVIQHLIVFPPLGLHPHVEIEEDAGVE